jgi:hypothetical protein
MKRLLLTFAFVLAAISAQAQVTYDAESPLSGAYQASPATWTLTMGAGSNGAAKVGLIFNGGSAPPGLAVSVGGNSATAAPGAAGGTSIYVIDYCVAMGSASGAQTVTVTWTGGGSFYVAGGAISAHGVKQSAPCINGNFSSSTSITITSASGDLTTTTYGGGAAGTTNKTLKWSSNAAATYYGNGDIGPGTGTTTHTWTGSSAREVGEDFQQAVTAVVAPTFTPPSGTFTSSLPQSTTVATGTSGAYLCVTTCNTNGCTPATPAATTPGTCSTGTQYNTNSQSLALLGNGYETISALGTESGYTNSSVTTSSQFQSTTVVNTIGGIALGRAAGNIYKRGSQILGYLPQGAQTIGPLSVPVSAANIYFHTTGTAGTNMTVASLNADTIGGAANWTNAATAQNTYVNSSGLPAGCNSLPSMRPVNIGNVLYSGSDAQVFQYTANGTTLASMGYTFSTASNLSSFLVAMCWDIPNADGGTYDMPYIECTGCASTHFAAILWTGGNIDLEDNPGGGDADYVCMAANPNTIYFIAIQYSGASGTKDTMKIWDQYGNLQCTVQPATTATTTEAANFFGVGSNGDLPQTNGVHFWNGPVTLNTTNGAFPQP